MDIIDIMLARAMTPQGKTEAYVAKAEKAAQKAAAAEASAAAAIDTVESAADEIATAREEAAALLEEAQEALETAQSAQINTLDTEDVDDEIKKLEHSINVSESGAVNTINLITTYPDNTSDTDTITKLYKITGNNQDGTMTQKAITDALNQKADSSVLNDYASIQYVTNAIAAIPTGGGSGEGGGNANTDVDANDSGHLVVVDENGNLTASDLTDSQVIDALINAGAYTAAGSVGLDIDYANRAFTRVQEATNKTMGNDFNTYTMYGGRTKCNVADDGTINAFYGDNNYTEDGSNGQVMIYQPKFYYKRVIRTADNLAKGRAVRHETLILSATEQSGFKLAPIFNGGLDYVLLPAYDASLIDNKLTSIAGSIPVNNLTIAQAEAYANNRGTGWHIMNMAAESANQMLEMVEFGSMNGQASIEEGITYIPSGSNGNGMFITGSTASLGNGTGAAQVTVMDVAGTRTNQTENGKRAICYRGMENPWGNLWSMIGGINVIGNGLQGGGVIYICQDFNYTPEIAGNNYEDIGFNLPSSYLGWINAMGYGQEKYDWIYMPIECSNNATSLLPVGDGLWTVPDLNGAMVVASGGSFGYKESCGPFYYAADRNLSASARNNYGAKLLFIPTKNATYTANIAKWNTYMGG